MSIFWVAAALLMAAAVVLVLYPLLRGRGGETVDRATCDLAVYQDQLAEIDHDVERGLVTPDQADAARLEINRRVLSLWGPSTSDGSTGAGIRRARAPGLAAALAIVLAAGVAGSYALLGSPGLRDAPLAARQAPQGAQTAAAEDAPSAQSVEEAVAELRRRLEANPEQMEGWLLLGRSYLALERFREGADAFRRALELSGARPDVASDYGEALVAAARGQVTPQAAGTFRLALAGNPRDAKARYYLALAAAQDGDLTAALRGWADVVALSPADAPWLPAVHQQMDRAAAVLGVDAGTVKPSPDVAAMAVRGPTSEDVAAAAELPAEERATMIRTMVERLAARLEEQPEDRDGWLRLARAYDVLGEGDKAAAARARANALTGN